MDIPTRVGVGGIGLAAVFALVPLAFEMPKSLILTGIFAGLLLGLWGFWPLIHKIFGKSDAKNTARRPLLYLSSRDVELSWAIKMMAWKSAWGRWYASQYLANGGTPIKEDYLFNMAGDSVREMILDGTLEVRGRLPGSMEYKSIPRTDWRSSAFHYFWAC